MNPNYICKKILESQAIRTQNINCHIGSSLYTNTMIFRFHKINYTIPNRNKLFKNRESIRCINNIVKSL